MGAPKKNPGAGSTGASSKNFVGTISSSKSLPSEQVHRRLTFTPIVNDDGHFCGLDSNWVSLGTASQRVVNRLRGVA